MEQNFIHETKKPTKRRIEESYEESASPQRRRVCAEEAQRVERYALSALPLRLLRASAVRCLAHFMLL
jgi:hypothetical protein